jgi:hypothetical protein
MDMTWPWNRKDGGTGSRDLAMDETLRIPAGRDGVLLRAERGVVLVTQAGDPEDHVLTPGEELRLPRGGLIVAQAFAAARLVVREVTAPAHRPDRRARRHALA